MYCHNTAVERTSDYEIKTIFQVQLFLNCIILISFCCVCVFLFGHLLVSK